MSLSRRVVSESSRVQGVAVVFLALSAADLFLTFALLQNHPRFVEANPVARWILERWNVAGMVVFKFGLVGFVITLGEVIERRRPGLGRLVLLLGCCVTAFAARRGLGLLLGVDPGSSGWLD